MAGYGIGSLAGAVTTPLVIARLPRVAMMVTGWIVLGATFLVLPWLDGSLPALALAAGVGGFATPFGIAALNALITEQTSGPDRRTAFATQQVAATGGSSLGMLSGGAVIAVLGAENTMHVAGVVLMSVPIVLVARNLLPRRRQDSRGTTPAADAPPRPERAASVTGPSPAGRC
jgi:predicted MFS family arabinose efflux permease